MSFSRGMNIAIKPPDLFSFPEVITFKIKCLFIYERYEGLYF